MKETWTKWGSLILMGFIFMGILLHAGQFSTAVGTIDHTINDIGHNLEGR